MTTTTETPTTEQVIFDMLTENTGRHMLDSGGAYGRNFERNSAKTLADFEAEHEAYWDGYGVTLSLFHFLRNVGDFDPEVDAEFEAFAMSPEFEKENWLHCAEEFLLATVGAGNFGVVNTYNNEDLLSQTIQYYRWDSDGGDWAYGDKALISVHGGCDVRGGYARPRAWDLNSSDHDLFDNARCGVGCYGQDPPQFGPDLFGQEHGRTYHSWSSYDGCNFEPNNDEDPFPSDMPLDDEGKPICPMCAAPLNFGPF